MEALRRDKKTILFFIAPALAFFLLVAAIPVLCSLAFGFFNWDVAGLKGFAGFRNYEQLFTTDKYFQLAVLNTFAVTLLCLAIQMPLAILLASVLRRRIFGKRFFKAVFFIPNIISSVAIGLLWIFVLHPDFGMVNSLLRFIGLDSLTHVWLGERGTALICVVIAVCWQYVGYHMIIFLCAMESIPDSVTEAAAIDGATEFRLFMNILLPMIAPIVKIDAVLISTGSLRIFDMIYIMTEGGPNHATEVIATHMYARSFKGMQFGYGSSMSVILMILCVAATLLLERAFKRAEENVQ